MTEGKVFNSVYDGALVAKARGSFYVSFRGVLFPILLNSPEEGKDRLIIFFPGSTRRQKPLPIFQRQTFSEHLDSDVICTADPTLFHAPDLTMAWFAGDRSRHYAATLGLLLNQFIKRRQYKSVLIYGTSAGGIPALQAARYITDIDVTVCVGNAQLNIFNYYQNHFQKLLDTAFNKIDKKLFEEKYSTRVNLNGYDVGCKLICMQNIDDTHHYEKHYLPFKDSYNALGFGTFVEYSDSILGHEPLPKEIEIRLIQAILNNSDNPFTEVPKARLSTK